MKSIDGFFLRNLSQNVSRYIDFAEAVIGHTLFGGTFLWSINLEQKINTEFYSNTRPSKDQIVKLKTKPDNASRPRASLTLINRA